MLPAVSAVVLALAALPAAASSPLRQPPGEVTGVVFLDRNGNGVCDANEPGIAGVAVSDQDTVVVTARDGRYRMMSRNSTGLVFMSVPEGYRAAGRFWAPVGSNAIVDFPLRRTPPSARTTFVHASDTHIAQGALPRMQRLRALIDSIRPSFLLITGDLVRDALRVGEAEATGYYELFNAEVIARIGLSRYPLALAGHVHTRESLRYAGVTTRFDQAGALVGATDGAGMDFPSGVTVYELRAGTVGEGRFVPLGLDKPRP